MAGAPFGDLIDRIRIRLLHVLCVSVKGQGVLWLNKRLEGPAVLICIFIEYNCVGLVFSEV